MHHDVWKIRFRFRRAALCALSVLWAVGAVRTVQAAVAPACSLPVMPYAHDAPSVAADTAVTEREQELAGAVVGGRRAAHLYARDGSERITFAGLTKMACCTVAESFQNTATVSQGFSDAVTGTRQIRLLGLGGLYTQTLDESRPVLRGLGAPYALSLTPGVWLSGISVAKGATSVRGGHDALTGQVNMDFRKPTDDERLFANVYVDEQLRLEANATTAVALKKDKSLSTLVLAHGAWDTEWLSMSAMDRNNDGYRDMPRSRGGGVANRWLWLTPRGWQLRWGARFDADERLGGSIHYDGSHAARRAMHDAWDSATPPPYGSRLRIRNVDAYLKAAHPVGRTFYTAEGEARQGSVALVADYAHFSTNAYYGLNDYCGLENSYSASLLWDQPLSPRSTLVVGAQARWAHYAEDAQLRTPWLTGATTADSLRYHRAENEAGAYAEYTFAPSTRLTATLGLRADWDALADRFTLTPRAHLMWQPARRTTLRLTAGLGHRTALPLADYPGLLATGRSLSLDHRTANDGYRHLDRQEKALTAGLSMQQRFSLLGEDNATLSLDYFRTQFLRSIVVDQEWAPDVLAIYSTTHRAWSDTWQADLTWTPIRRLDVTATFRYNNSRQTLSRPDGTTVRKERALTDRFKGVFNVQYATALRRWVFDATVQLVGPARLPAQDGNPDNDSHSPTHALIFAQVTRHLGRLELYAGCENLADYRQHDALQSPENPYDAAFNSLNVWGPLMGRRFYLGLRFNLY